MNSWDSVKRSLAAGEAAQAKVEAEALLLEEDGNPEGWFLLGAACQMLEDASEAEKAYRRSIELNPQPVPPRLNLARVLVANSRYGEAIRELELLIAQHPENAFETQLWLARLYSFMEHWPKAVALYAQVLEAAPQLLAVRLEYWDALLGDNNPAVASADLEVCLGQQGGAEMTALSRAVLAVAAARWELAMPPEVGGWSADADPMLRARIEYYRACADGYLVRWPEVLARLQPGLLPQEAAEELHDSLSVMTGFAALGLGDWQRGWHDYTARRAGREGVNMVGMHMTIPVWRGESLVGKTLLVHGEQGIGDVLMTLRYIPLLAGMAKGVMLNLPPEMIRFFEGEQALPDTAMPVEKFAGADLQIRLMDIPGLVNEGKPWCPPDFPYLQPAADRAAYWAARLPRIDCPRVGIVWTGNPKLDRDASRSSELAELSPLFAVPGLTWHAVQKGPSELEAADYTSWSAWQPLSGEIRDLQDTAAIIQQLDLVVTVDTSVAHLAGAMGKPVWILLGSSAIDWRWGAQGEQSVWYPSARLWRRPLGQGRLKFVQEAMLPELARWAADRIPVTQALLQAGCACLAEEGMPLPDVSAAVLEHGGGSTWLRWLGFFISRYPAEHPKHQQSRAQLQALAGGADVTLAYAALAKLAEVGDVDALQRLYVAGLRAIDSIPDLGLVCVGKWLAEADRWSDLQSWLSLFSERVLIEFPYRLNQLKALLHFKSSDPGSAAAFLAPLRAAYPRYAPAAKLLAHIEEQHGRLELALSIMGNALQMHPEDAGLWSGLARVALRMGARRLACLAARHAVEMGDNWALPLLQKAATELNSKDDLAYADEMIERYLSGAQPVEESAWADRLALLYSLPLSVVYPRCTEELLSAPAVALTSNALGLHRLRLGGGAEASAIFHMTRPVKIYGLPSWQPNTAGSGKLVVYQDAGLGDQIEALRGLSFISAGRSVTFFVGNDLLPLLAKQDWSFPMELRSSEELSQEAVDSLGAVEMAPLYRSYMQIAFNQALPNRPYMRVPDELEEAWRSRLEDLQGKRVGILWAGQKRYGADHFRSTRLEDWLSLAERADISLVSLQKDEASDQALWFPQLRLFNAAAECNSLLETAALLRNLDLVVCVDSGVAHLAASLGVPTWMLLPAWAVDWRWGIQGDSSTLYPTLRLMRQSPGQSWADLIGQIKDEI